MNTSIIKRLKTEKRTASDRSALLISRIVSGIVILLLFLFFRRLSPFIYQINDDFFLKTLVSGEVCGIPQAHLLHISYPTGLLLSGLYRLTPTIPWYGLFLCSVIGLTLTLILSRLLLSERTLFSRLLTILLFCFFCYGFLFLHIAELQFTTVAAMAGCGALFLFSLAPPRDSLPETLKSNIGFLLLSACAFCTRKDVLFMLFPFIGVIGAEKYLDAGKNSGIPLFRINRQRKYLMTLGGVFIAVVLSLVCIETLAYQDDDWSAFSQYNTARANVYDYDGYPDYDTWQETYLALGISRSSYEAAAHHYCIALEPQINQRSLNTLAKITEENNRFSFSSLLLKLKQMTEAFLERHLSYTDRPLNLLVYCCYILFFICSILSQKYHAARDIIFLIFARMSIWIYLLFHGRYPFRVSQSVYLAELTILLAITFGNKLWEFSKRETHTKFLSKNRICKAFWIITITFLSFICLRFGFPKAKAIAWESSSRLQFSQAYADIKKFFSSHPDNFYYLDMNSFSSITEDALQTTTGDYENFIYMGSWLPNSPWYDRKLEKAGILNPAEALYKDPHVFAVFMNTPVTGYEYLTNFYAENYPGISLEVIETVPVSGDLQFLILKAYASRP